MSEIGCFSLRRSRGGGTARHQHNTQQTGPTAPNSSSTQQQQHHQQQHPTAAASPHLVRRRALGRRHGAREHVDEAARAAKDAAADVLEQRLDVLFCDCVCLYYKRGAGGVATLEAAAFGGCRRCFFCCLPPAPRNSRDRKATHKRTPHITTRHYAPLCATARHWTPVYPPASPGRTGCSSRRPPAPPARARAPWGAR